MTLLALMNHFRILDTRQEYQECIASPSYLCYLSVLYLYCSDGALYPYHCSSLAELQKSSEIVTSCFSLMNKFVHVSEFFDSLCLLDD